MNYQLIIIIVLLLLLIGTFSILRTEYVYYKQYENARILKNIQISEIYDTLKSGDIILYKCNTLSFAGMLGSVYYTHIGMVIKTNDEQFTGKDIYKSDLYISETNPAYEYLPKEYDSKNWYGLRPHSPKKQIDGWKTNYGTDFLPLLVRIKYFAGDCFIMRLNKELDVKKKKILFSAIDKNCPYPTPLQGLQILAEKQLFKKQKTYARHCYQHIANLLDQMGLTNNMLESNGFLSICNKVGYIDTQKLNDGYKYETPIKIIYDI